MFRSIDLSIYRSIYVSIYLSVCLPVCLSIYLPVYLPAWKPSYSARHPHFSKLTISKTQQFCETSSFFELNNIQNEAILRDFFNFWIWQHQKQSNSARLPSKIESWVQRWRPRTNVFFFHSTLSKVLRLPRKIDARSYEVLHLSRKIILANLQVWCSKMQSLSGNQRPDLLTSLMNMSFVLRLPREMHLCRSASNVPRMPSFFGNATIPSCFAHFWEGAQSLAPATRKHIWTVPVSFLHFWLRNVLRATTACTFSTSQLLKVVRSWCVLYILISKCSSRHNGVHFIALFSTSQLLKMDRSWCVLYILTSKCASRHNGVQFFISHLARWLRTRRLLFDPPEPQIIGQTVFRDFPTFSRIGIFFLLTLSLLWSSLFYSSLIFSLLLFSSLWVFPSLLSSVHIVGSLTSKLPSIRVCGNHS